MLISQGLTDGSRVKIRGLLGLGRGMHSTRAFLVDIVFIYLFLILPYPVKRFATLCYMNKNDCYHHYHVNKDGCCHCCDLSSDWWAGRDGELPPQSAVCGPYQSVFRRRRPRAEQTPSQATRFQLVARQRVTDGWKPAREITEDRRKKKLR